MPTLNWAGKDKVVNHHLEVPFHFLERRYSFDANGRHDEDIGAENCIIHGDNLLALKALLPQYAGRVKCIYIDPPYNTGEEKWVYNDSVNDPQIKKWLGQVVGPEGMDFSRHDKWLCMMYPRLRLLQKLLSDDGVLWISIGDDELANLLLVMREIMGEPDGIFVWKSRSKPTGAGNAKFRPQKVAEYVLAYTKDKGHLYNIPNKPSEYSYPYEDEYGRYRTTTILTSNFGTYKRETMRFSIGHYTPPPEKRWKAGRDKILELLENHRLTMPETGDPMKKVYDYDDNNILSPLYTLIDVNVSGTAETGKATLNKVLGAGHGFDTVKPVELLQYLIGLSTDKDSIVLDSFAGSGTTAHAVLKLNQADGGHRKFICIEMMDYAETVTAERVKRVIQGYGSGKNAVPGTGGAFSFYELGPSLLVENKLNPDLPPERLREYIWQAEVRQTAFPHRHALSPTKQDGGPYLLGVDDETAYYLIPSGRLDKGALQQIQTKAKNYVVYAELCTLDEAFLAHWHIVFKKIPRDLPQP